MHDMKRHLQQVQQSIEDGTRSLVQTIQDSAQKEHRKALMTSRKSVEEETQYIPNQIPTINKGFKEAKSMKMNETIQHYLAMEFIKDFNETRGDYNSFLVQTESLLYKLDQ